MTKNMGANIFGMRWALWNLRNPMLMASGTGWQNNTIEKGKLLERIGSFGERVMIFGATNGRMARSAFRRFSAYRMAPYMVMNGGRAMISTPYGMSDTGSRAGFMVLNECGMRKISSRGGFQNIGFKVRRSTNAS